MKKNAFLVFRTSLLVFALAGFLSAMSSCSNTLSETDPVRILESETISSSISNPVAKIEAPAFMEGGVPKNRNLIISFSRPMDTESFWDKLIITDSMGKNLKDYFCSPVWSNEDTVVEITPNPDNLIDLKNKAYFDIYVTISKTVSDKNNNLLYNPIDYRYRINETVDDILPELVASRAELPKSYLSDYSEETMLLLAEGEFTPYTEEVICTTNHINSKFDFYIEGNDYGSGEVWARFKYHRIYDAQGNSVNEQELSKLVKLTKMNFSDNYYDIVCFDLSDSRYLDGMYRIEAALVDESGMQSANSKVINVIRDTSFASSPNAAINFCSQAAEEEEFFTKEQLESFEYKINFSNTGDDIYFISKIVEEEEIEKGYYNPSSSFTYLLSWGLSLSELNEPVRVYMEEDYFILPEAYRAFRYWNKDKELYLSATIIDEVGNKAVINSVVPALIDFFNYEVWDGSEEEYKKIKLNFANLANTNNDVSELPDKINCVSYRIYYGRKDDANLELKGIDSVEFEIEDNSTYTVYIQPVYTLISRTNGQWSGQSYGPLYELEVDSISSGEDPEQYSFEVSKAGDGINSGTFTINVDISNTEEGVSYYPCYSVDGQNWNTYKDLSFKVQNPLKAPVASEQAWASNDVWNDFWEGKTLFEARDLLAEQYQDVTAFVRILAVKGNKTVYSDPKEIVFTREDDNIPPAVSSLISSHDSMLSYDGRSYKFEGLIKEDDLNTKEIFRYYYAEYNESWGNNLYCLEDQQITELPGSVSKLASKVWRADDGSIQYRLTPVIPINGLKDGKYMFFAKISDLYGNEKIVSLGKTEINTFKNKLKVSYDSKYNQFNSSLALTENEVAFSRNMINIQLLSVEQNGNSYSAQWNDFYEEQNELQNCTVDAKKRILTNTTKNSIEVIDGRYGTKLQKTKNLTKGAFYRISVQSFNENTYNEQTNRGVNKKNGRPYGDTLEAVPVVELVENETEYDLYTQETVSNPMYYYIPASDEDMSKFKGSFFKNTVAISTNKPVIINLISSLTDLGSNIDEWERRGKLIKTYYFKGDSSGIPFKDNDVREDMLKSDEEGLVYYVMVVHFANNTSEMSNVYKIQK